MAIVSKKHVLIGDSILATIATKRARIRLNSDINGGHALLFEDGSGLMLLDGSDLLITDGGTLFASQVNNTHSPLTMNPIGGGPGYIDPNPIKRTDAQWIVDNTNITKVAGGGGYPKATTAANFQTLLQTDVVATNIVWLDKDLELDLSDTHGNTPAEVGMGQPESTALGRIVIDKAMTIASDRGQDDSRGALLFNYKEDGDDADFSNNSVLEFNAEGIRITGVRLRGSNLEQQWIDSLSAFIRITAINCEIDNCEIFGCSKAAIFIQEDYGYQQNIHHNYIHHTRVQDPAGYGYGVWVSSAATARGNPITDKTKIPLIECNLFEYCRHDVAQSGNQDSDTNSSEYIARYNWDLEHNNLVASFDSHTTPGRVEIYRNVIDHMIHSVYAGNSKHLAEFTDPTDPISLSTIRSIIKHNYSNHTANEDAYNMQAPPIWGVHPSGNILNQTWRTLRPSIGLTCSTTSGGQQITCKIKVVNKTDPEKFEISQYIWRYNNDRETRITNADNITLTFDRVGTYPVSCYPKNAVGIVGEPRTVILYVTENSNNPSLFDELSAWWSMSETSRFTDKLATSVTVTVGTQSSGTYASTWLDDGTYNQFTDTADEIDIYYEFDTGLSVCPPYVQIIGYMLTSVDTTNDMHGVYAYDWGRATWQFIGTYDDSTSAVDTTRTYVLYQRFLGTGANAGKVRIRFWGTGMSSGTATLSIDKISLVNYSRYDAHGENHLVEVLDYSAGTFTTVAAGNGDDTFRSANGADFTATSSSRLDVPNYRSAGVQIYESDWTLCMWVYPKVIDASNKVVWQLGSAPSGNNGLVIQTQAEAGDVIVKLVDDVMTWSSGTQALDIVDTNVNKWHFLMFRVNRTAGTLDLYKNGPHGDVAEKTITGVSISASLANNLMTDSRLKVSDGDWAFIMNEVCFWHRAITDAERDWLYNSGAGRGYGEARAGDGDQDAVVVAASGGDYTTIQSAVDAGKAVIYVENASYTENLTLNQANQHIILLGGTITGTVAVSAAGVKLECRGATTITGVITWTGDKGVLKANSQLTTDLIDVDADNFTGDGGGYGTDIESISIAQERHSVTDFYIHSVSGGSGYNALELKVAAGTTRYNNIAFNYINDSDDVGIVTESGSTENIISGNYVFGADNIGMTPKRAICSGNLIENTASDGVTMQAGGEDTLVGSNIVDQLIQINSGASIEDVVLYGNRTDRTITDGGTNTLSAANNTAGI